MPKNFDKLCVMVSCCGWRSTTLNLARQITKRYNPGPITIINVTVTLTLKPELEAGLVAQAHAKGMTLEEYLLSLIEGASFSAENPELSPEKRAAAFQKWVASHTDTTDLSDYAVSRESMYEGHDD